MDSRWTQNSPSKWTCNGQTGNDPLVRITGYPEVDFEPPAKSVFYEQATSRQGVFFFHRVFAFAVVCSLLIRVVVLRRVSIRTFD
jgi:hypothetical protein